MRIGIDGRLIGETGIGVYTLELLRAMLAEAKKEGHEFEFVLFLPQEKMAMAQETFPKELAAGKLELARADFHWYGLAEQLRFPGIIRRAKVDLMHFPHFNVPILTRTPFVVTIHDLILLGHPSTRATRLSPWKFALKKVAWLAVMHVALRRAKAVFALTKFGKKDLLRHFGSATKAGKIFVTSEGTGQSDIPPAKKDDKSLLFKYNIKKPFLLYVGNAYPHKNLDVLVLAFAKLLEEGRDWQLVIAGKDDDFRKELKGRCRALGVWGDPAAEDRVIFTGYVKKEELAAMYQQAILYVFPSLYEGFGLPPLEAMRYGLPVVSSDRTCLPEVLGDAAEYFDPSDPANICQAIARVADSPQRAQELRGLGRARAGEYSWGRAAHITIKQYERFLPHAKAKKKRKGD